MNAPGADRRLLKPARDVGITGYGAYIPRFRLPAKEVARVWKGGQGGLPVKEKAVSGIDEDVITMSIEAARNALARGQVDPSMIRAVWVGSESHPYSVKPTSTVVAEAIGATPHTQAADWQFACKAGTEAVQAAIGFVGSGMADYALSIGMDTAQGRPGDALEYTTGAGGAAILLGPADDSLAIFEGSYSYATDTPDFWRRADEKYPEHGERFTGEPAYFKHIQEAGSALMQTLGRGPEDFRYAVFHQPNTKFPQRSALVGLTAILDEAAPGDRILLVSYGSGAGSDAFSLVATERLPQRRGLAPSTREYIARRTEIDYATYARYRGKLTLS
ncbi:MAG: hydroxymethylglutaryl-coenzyme synthase family protein [Anaerolineales bacterium]|nr:hydroxymethylglutaryl-coenzyme synthase family protein [Anaerolineales bacterium]